MMKPKGNAPLMPDAARNALIHWVENTLLTWDDIAEVLKRDHGILMQPESVQWYANRQGLTRRKAPVVNAAQIMERAQLRRLDRRPTVVEVVRRDESHPVPTGGYAMFGDRS